MLTYVVFSRKGCQACLNTPHFHRVTHYLNLNLRHVYSHSRHSDFIGKLFANEYLFFATRSLEPPWTISCSVLEQLTRAGFFFLLAAQHVFPSHASTAGGWCDASVPDSPSHLPQSALTRFGLAGLATAQWRSCVSTHTQKTHCWK